MLFITATKHGLALLLYMLLIFRKQIIPYIMCDVCLLFDFVFVVVKLTVHAHEMVGV